MKEISMLILYLSKHFTAKKGHGNDFATVEPSYETKLP